MTAEIDPGDTNSPNPKTKEGALFCYKHPEYRLPNTVFFIINITPHRGDGALLTGVPRLI
jgi:hypothetical protein